MGSRTLDHDRTRQPFLFLSGHRILEEGRRVLPWRLRWLQTGQRQVRSLTQLYSVSFIQSQECAYIVYENRVFFFKTGSRFVYVVPAVHLTESEVP